MPKNDTKAKLLMHMFHGRHDDLDIHVKLQEYFLLHVMVVFPQKKWGKAFENDFNKGRITIVVVALGCFPPFNGNLGGPPQAQMPFKKRPFFLFDFKNLVYCLKG